MGGMPSAVQARDLPQPQHTSAPKRPSSKKTLYFPLLPRPSIPLLPKTPSQSKPTTRSEVLLEKLTLCRDRGVVQVRLAHDGEAAIAGKLEVGGGAAGVDLANELARGVPDLDAVAAAGVDVALGVDVNTCCMGQFWVLKVEDENLTIGDVDVGKGKGLAVLKGAVLLDVEAVAAWG